jgi:hypothetical protein
LEAAAEYDITIEQSAGFGRPLLPVLVRDVAIQLVHPAITRRPIVDYRKRTTDSVLALMAGIANRPPVPPLRDPLPATPNHRLRESSIRSLALEVVEGDITAFAADLVAFNYARGFHGADRQVAQLPRTAGISSRAPDRPTLKHGCRCYPRGPERTGQSHRPPCR